MFLILPYSFLDVICFGVYCGVNIYIKVKIRFENLELFLFLMEKIQIYYADFEVAVTKNRNILSQKLELGLKPHSHTHPYDKRRVQQQQLGPCMGTRSHGIRAELDSANAHNLHARLEPAMEGRPPQTTTRDPGYTSSKTNTNPYYRRYPPQQHWF